MNRLVLLIFIILSFISKSEGIAILSEPIIIDHTSTDITQIPEWAITQAKELLHIAYSHTSHGFQITNGMTGLVDFANKGGKGLILPENIFSFNNGGIDGGLDLHDFAMPGDIGYYPDWIDNTRAYLENENNFDINVVMWSWCGQVDAKYASDTLFSEYIYPMERLEIDYPHITFVYMTGHVDHFDDANNKAANQIIRDYCEANNKVLYDFADIESHDPNGIYYPFSDDNCDYYESLNGELLGNWAIEWQESHIVGVDWYDCYSSHSEPLNLNQKAYAAWWLFARLAGWTGQRDKQQDEISQGETTAAVH